MYRKLKGLAVAASRIEKAHSVESCGTPEAGIAPAARYLLEFAGRSGRVSSGIRTCRVDGRARVTGPQTGMLREREQLLVTSRVIQRLGQHDGRVRRVGRTLLDKAP